MSANTARNVKKQDLVFTRVFDAPVEQVWKAWVQPELVIVLDMTIVNVALPSIRADLGFSETSLVWVVNASRRPPRPTDASAYTRANHPRTGRLAFTRRDRRSDANGKHRSNQGHHKPRFVGRSGRIRPSDALENRGGLCGAGRVRGCGRAAAGRGAKAAIKFR